MCVRVPLECILTMSPTGASFLQKTIEGKSNSILQRSWINCTGSCYFRWEQIHTDIFIAIRFWYQDVVWEIRYLELAAASTDKMEWGYNVCVFSCCSIWLGRFSFPKGLSILHSPLSVALIPLRILEHLAGLGINVRWAIAQTSLESVDLDYWSGRFVHP